MGGALASPAAATPLLLTIPYAARMYVTATLSSAIALTAGHGLAVDIEFEEYMPESYRTVTPVTWNSTQYSSYNGVGANPSALCPDTFNLSDSTKTRSSNSIVLNQLSRPQRVAIVGFVANAALTITNSGATVLTSPVWIQSSLDGTNWFNADSLVVAKIPAGNSGIYLGEEEAKPWPAYIAGACLPNNIVGTPGISATKETGVAKQGVLSKYMRLKYGPTYRQAVGGVVSASSATCTGHRYWVIAFY
jgi:hypothetical protein